ncbi:F-box protein-like [Dorcoceras hygrometricum]|uniref:F-box protein-like n=1 Tax=Dorcoceras hygrometricum TaxID=472368 RepID=A0A2Z7BXT1_9LAMI|nr:F-box protein-like [Dorcoceras hygrometricum]
MIVAKGSGEPHHAVEVVSGASRRWAGASTCRGSFSLVGPWFEVRSVTLEPSGPGGGPVRRALALVAVEGQRTLRPAEPSGPGVVQPEGLRQWWPEQGERTQKPEAGRGDGCLGVQFGLGLFLENWFGLSEPVSAGSVGPDRFFGERRLVLSVDDFNQLYACIEGRVGLRFQAPDFILSDILSWLSTSVLRTLVAIQISRACFVVIVAQKYKHVAYMHDIPFQLWQPLPFFVVASLFSYQDARASGDSALSFTLCAEWLATTVHRLGVDASGKGGRVGHVAYTHDIPFQLWQPLPCFVVASLFSYQDARASGDSALSFPLCAEWLATTVHRLGVDASGKGGRVGAAVDRQSGPRPDSRHLRQPALEGLTNSARTKTPRQADRNKSDHGKRRRHTAAAAACGFRGGGGGQLSTCVTLNGSGIQLAVGPQPLRLRNHNFGLVQRIMVKRLTTSPHDPIGITGSACKNQLVVVSVQYGHFNTYIPIRSTTIGKSRVARDPIAMHTSWRSNSDITGVTSIGYPRTRASGESSTTMHRLLHASGSHPIPPPNDPK